MAFGDGMHFGAKKVAPYPAKRAYEKGSLATEASPVFYEGPYPFEDALAHGFKGVDHTDPFILDLEMEAFNLAMRRDRLPDGRYVLKVPARHMDKAKALGAKVDKQTGLITVSVPPFRGFDKRLRWFCW